MSEFKNVALKDLFSEIKDSAIVLPNFQRSFVWSTEKQKSLLASMIVDLTFGIALVIKGDGDRFAVRPVGCNTYLDSEQLKGKEVLYVLDGQQRITSLFSMFNTAWRNSNYDDVFKNLKNLWFLHLDYQTDDALDPLSDDDADIFGYQKLIFDEKSLSKCTSDMLEGYIECKQVAGLKSKPFYKDNIFAIEYRSRIIEECVKNKMIPLFWLFDESYWQSIRQIVKGIRNERRDQLEAWFLSPANKDKRAKFYEQSLDINSNLDYDSHLSELKNGDYTDDILKETYWDELRETLCENWNDNVIGFLGELTKRYITLLVLGKDEFERSINIFSALNEGGTPLGLFDLAVARTSLSNKEGNDPRTLNDISNEIIEETIWVPGTDIDFSPKNFGLIEEKSECLATKVSDQIFMMTMIGCACGYSADNGYNTACLEQLKASAYKPKSVLSNKIETVRIRKSFEDSCRTIFRVSAFAYAYLGLHNFSEIRYTKMITPLACALAQDSIWNSPNQLKRLEAWYWYAVFSGCYDKNVNAMSHADIFNVLNLLDCAQGIDVTNKTKKYYRNYEELIEKPFSSQESGNEIIAANNILNMPEYSDYSIFASDNANKKLLDSLKSFINNTGIGTELLTSENSGKSEFFQVTNEESFDDFRAKVIEYIQAALHGDSLTLA